LSRPASQRDSGSPGLFISWAPFSRRTQSLAARFGLEWVHVRAPWFKRPLYAPLKYPLQIVRTWRLLTARDPAEVWVMDPPVPAVLTAWLYCRRRGRPLVVDMHTVGFYDPKWRALRRLEMPALREAASNVVTNADLAGRVRAWGCPVAILTDPLPAPPDLSGVERLPGTATIIATFSEDEPIKLLPEVASAMRDVRFFVTGRPRLDTTTWPANLVATGFLGDADFWRRLAASAVIVVLTTRPNTLLSGGYEALSLSSPLVVSDHSVLREYFEDAAVYVGDDAASIVAGVREALARTAELAERSTALAARREAEWASAAERLLTAVRGPR
jgi:glycosyltransferase involved in cell wall biosynthesis